MSRFPRKRVTVKKKPLRHARREPQVFPRRSSYMELSADTLASLNEDFSKLKEYKTAEELIKALNEETS